MLQPVASNWTNLPSDSGVKVTPSARRCPITKTVTMLSTATDLQINVIIYQQDVMHSSRSELIFSSR